MAKDDLALPPTHGFSCYYHLSTGRNFSQLSELWCMLVLTEAMTLLRNTSLKCRMPDGSEALVSNVGVWVNHSSCQRPCRITETGNWLYYHVSAAEKQHAEQMAGTGASKCPRKQKQQKRGHCCGLLTRPFGNDSDLGNFWLLSFQVLKNQSL